MAKRQSLESRMVQYFRTAPLEQAEVMLGLAQGELRARRPARGERKQASKKLADAVHAVHKANAKPVDAGAVNMGMGFAGEVHP